MDSALIQEEFSDFILKEEATSVWITVDNMSVYVRRSTSGQAVAVDIYPKGMEMEDPICGTWAEFKEAEEKLKEYEHQLASDDNRRRAIANWPGLRDGPDGDA